MKAHPINNYFKHKCPTYYKQKADSIGLGEKSRAKIYPL